tara:strand:- start:448 stop:1551 length:1104 start_codon:yes stop_codon:yes gene_type:complete
MNILGFNPSHHGSVCLLQDGELKHFIQEERVGNREKHSDLPFKSFIDILQNYKIDFITWGTPSIKYPINNLDTSDFPYWQSIAESYNPKIEYYDFSLQHHHNLHAAHSFYNSGFKKCIGVVIDGLGSFVKDNNKNKIGQETESVFLCSYPHSFKVLYKNFRSFKSQTINLSQSYETVTMYLGWSIDEAGKTMGLSPYGKYDPNIPHLIENNSGNPKVFYGLLENPKTFIDKEKNPQLKLQRDPKEWHYDKTKITDLEKDLAWKIQNDTQQLVGDYIEKSIQETGLKQVCCAGGYFLNCVTNYYLLKRFPDVKFYFEPIANDAGTAIGAAKLIWHRKTQDTTLRPFKSLYLGKQYPKEELLKVTKKYT